jgi:hypothetical protein
VLDIVGKPLMGIVMHLANFIMFKPTIQGFLKVEHFFVIEIFNLKKLGHTFGIVKNCSTSRMLWRSFNNF